MIEMKRTTIAIGLALSTSFVTPVAQAQNILACGALLCLSGGGVYPTCGQYLTPYYAIRGVTPAETKWMRYAYLLTCAMGGDGSLERVISNGAGYCEVDNLTALLNGHGVAPSADPHAPYDDGGGDWEATALRQRYNDCRAYADHEYTYNVVAPELVFDSCGSSSVYIWGNDDEYSNAQNGVYVQDGDQLCRWVWTAPPVPTQSDIQLQIDAEVQRLLSEAGLH